MCPTPTDECEKEAWAHEKVTRVTRCADGVARCTCAPHFVLIYDAWKTRPLPLESFNMPLPDANKSSEYR